MGASYAASYSGASIGSIAGVPSPYGGILFLAGDPNTLLIGGAATENNSAIYAVPLIRGADHHIAGFGSPAFYASATGIDGGLQYAPNGTILYADQNDISLGEIKSGSTVPNKQFPLGPALSGAPGGLVVVPSGFGPAGHIKMLPTFGFTWYDATPVPDGAGTYNLSNIGPTIHLPFSPEAAVYVAAGAPGFPTNTVLIDDWGSPRSIISYQVDGNGDPILATAQTFASNVAPGPFSGPEGAAFDPVTGDLLVSTLDGSPDVIFEFRGFPVPEPSAGVVLIVPASIAMLKRKPREQRHRRSLSPQGGVI
jgi:hypothetical protein